MWNTDLDKEAYIRTLKSLRDTSKLKRRYWATEKEAQVLFSRVGLSKSQYYIESGTCHGFTSCWVALTDVEKIHTFDPANREKIWNRPSLKGLSDKIIFYNQEFDQGITQILEKISTKDPIFYFIDGNHSPTGIAKDFNVIEPFFKPGDKIMFHDTLHEHGVFKFVARVSKRFPQWDRANFDTERGMTEFTVTSRQRITNETSP